jgi:pimeloyl-CoA synthetase
LRENTHAKRNRANHSLLSGKRFDAAEDRELRPISVRWAAGFRGHASEFTLKSNTLKRTKIALALPSYMIDSV